MKKGVLFSLFVLITAGLSAQLTAPNVVFEKDGPVVSGEHVIYVYIKNESGKMITPDWLRVVNDMPGSWGSRVCIGELCYDQSVGAGTFLSPMGNGGESQISLYIDDDGQTAGEGNVALSIYDPNDSAQTHITIEFTYIGWPVGIDEPKAGEVTVYPNPTSAHLFMDLGEVQVDHFRLLDITGRTVEQSAIPVGADRATIDVKDYAPGTYFIQLLNHGEVLVTKPVQKK